LHPNSTQNRFEWTLLQQTASAAESEAASHPTAARRVPGFPAGRARDTGAVVCQDLIAYGFAATAGPQPSAPEGVASPARARLFHEFHDAPLASSPGSREFLACWRRRETHRLRGWIDTSWESEERVREPLPEKLAAVCGLTRATRTVCIADQPPAELRIVKDDGVAVAHAFHERILSSRVGGDSSGGDGVSLGWLGVDQNPQPACLAAHFHPGG